MLLEVRLNKRANYLTSKRRCFHESRKRRGRRQNNPDRRLENDIHRIMNMVHMKKYGINQNDCYIYLLSEDLTSMNLHRSA